MNPTLSRPQRRPMAHWAKTFLALFGLGMLGVLSLIPMMMDQLTALPPEVLELPIPVVAMLSMLNSMILLALAVALGTLLADRVGLRSLVAERVRTGAPIWPQLRPAIPMAFGLGLSFLLGTVLLDRLIDPFANAEMLGELPAAGNSFIQLMMGVLYGGITEELLLRWGVMTLFVWIGWRIVQRGAGPPHPALVWTAIILAALLFGLGHLPALSAIVVLTPVIVIRTVLLNALGGIIFGWLFWRKNLETAMVAHATFHIGMFFINFGVWISQGG